MLRIFAVRVNAEFERVAAEAALRASEAQLRQAQKMQAIGQLTGGIAHDFNNLLTGIMGYVMLAGERAADGGDRQLTGYLLQAQRSCERARDLIQQMLMFSRGQRGAPRTFALGELVETWAESLRHTLPATLELAADISSDAPPVCADPLQVEQVLLNLCINARDAVKGTGKVGVVVRPLVAEGLHCAGCHARVDGPFVEMSISDEGHGMAPEVLERIFEPFFSTKEPGKGTGMGLAMVHGIVHEHRGHVVVETAVGRGARFRVLWPAQSAAGTSAREVSTHEDAVVGGSRPRLQGSVLVVDDQATVGEFMRELLRTWGMDAHFAQTARAALDLVAGAGEAFDVVITDQAMAGMTGLQLAEALHESRPGLPVILYTGYADGLEETQLRAARVHAVLGKPIEPAALEAVLSGLLTRPAIPASLPVPLRPRAAPASTRLP